eukprot:7260345-Prymnesium_polylepis.2
MATPRPTSCDGGWQLPTPWRAESDGGGQPPSLSETSLGGLGGGYVTKDLEYHASEIGGTARTRSRTLKRSSETKQHKPTKTNAVRKGRRQGEVRRRGLCGRGRRCGGAGGRPVQRSGRRSPGQEQGHEAARAAAGTRAAGGRTTSGMMTISNLTSSW